MNSSAIPSSLHPIVAIIGRPNVGKSSLFNCIAQRRLAIVHQESGITRDRVMSTVNWRGKIFNIIDTGGLSDYLNEKINDSLNASIRKQLLLAIESATKVIFLVDVQSGLQCLDYELASLLRKTAKSVVLAANKADNTTIADMSVVFDKLGLNAAIPISCQHNLNLDRLLDDVSVSFPLTRKEAENRRALVNIAVVGRPNVGKSSIINRLLGHDRVIVDDIPGTTRDVVDIPFRIQLENESEPFIANVIDTAGLRHRRRRRNVLDVFSMQRTERVIHRADLLIMVLDASNPAVNEDKKIYRLISDAKKPCLILLNKWDLACRYSKEKALIEVIKKHIPAIIYQPILSCCAQSGYHFSTILPTLIQLHRKCNRSIPTGILNRIIQKTVQHLSPPLYHGKRLKIYYAVYKQSQPPTFLLFVNNPAYCKRNYMAYLHRKLRENFDLDGVPLSILMQSRHNDKGL